MQRLCACACTLRLVMNALTDLDLKTLGEAQVRAVASELIARIKEQNQALNTRQLKIDLLTHELANLKRLRFSAKTESLKASGQLSLMDESLDEDLAALTAALAQEQAPESSERPEGKAAVARRKAQRSRPALPADLPRTEIRHDPRDLHCPCGCALKRIGEDISEKLDYVPGRFSVERHIRGRWACAGRCEQSAVVQAPMPAQLIDRGLATADLLAHVLIAKYADHLPLYRQERIYARQGVLLGRSTLASWVGQCGVALAPLVAALKGELLQEAVLHADETPVGLLDPGSGKTKRAYLWAYASTAQADLKAVVYDFSSSRSGKHARAFLGQGDEAQRADGLCCSSIPAPRPAPWCGTLVVDDYGGYKALFGTDIQEAGCLAHARRKFHELWASHQSPIAQEALAVFGRLYEIERQATALSADERLAMRQARARPIAEAFRQWLIVQRGKVPDGGAIAKAIDYSLKRYEALIHYLTDGRVPIDNNWVENQIRPIALGRKNWLFAGSLMAGKRAAAIMSLIQSAKLNGLEPYAYLTDVLTRLPTTKMKDIDALLPHRWQPETACA